MYICVIKCTPDCTKKNWYSIFYSNFFYLFQLHFSKFSFPKYLHKIPKHIQKYLVRCILCTHVLCMIQLILYMYFIRAIFRFHAPRKTRNTHWLAATTAENELTRFEILLKKVFRRLLFLETHKTYIINDFWCVHTAAENICSTNLNFFSLRYSRKCIQRQTKKKQ